MVLNCVMDSNLYCEMMAGWSNYLLVHLTQTHYVSSRMESVEIGLDTYTADTIAAHKKIRQVTIV
jgi:hypothetical protein